MGSKKGTLNHINHGFSERALRGYNHWIDKIIDVLIHPFFLYFPHFPVGHTGSVRERGSFKEKTGIFLQAGETCRHHKLRSGLSWFLSAFTEVYRLVMFLLFLLSASLSTFRCLPVI